MELKEIIDKIGNDIDLLDIRGNELANFSSITSNSKEAGAGSMFVAIKGYVVDGHKYISSAQDMGASIIVCENLPDKLNPNIGYLVVKNSSIALGIIASEFYGNPSKKLKVVGVTGTNGKTTIVSLLYQLFSNLGYKCGLFGTVANYIGNTKLSSTHTTPDPITLNKIMCQMVEEGCQYCFMEVSSHAIHQHRIAGLCFAGAAFTNLSHDHLDYHKTFKDYRDAKKMFFDDLNNNAFALVNIDDKNGMFMLQNCKANHYTYSVKSQANFKAKIVEASFEGMQLLIDSSEVWTPFVGDFNAQNLLAVYGVAMCLGQDKNDVLLSLSQLHSVDGRFQTIRSSNGITAIVDYAHTPDALKNVINTIIDLKDPSQELITVVGAGGDRDVSKRPEMACVAAQSSSKLILTSDNPRTENPQDIINDMLKGIDSNHSNKTLSMCDRREAIKTACMLAKPLDVILIAGKGHETYQEINGVRHHFDDREIVSEIFASIN